MTADAVGGSVSCPDTCDGEILLEVSNGCPPYAFNIGGGPDPNNPPTGLTDLCAGMYTIEITDCNGCVAQTMAEVVIPDQVPFGLALIGDSLVADEGYLTYDWYLADTLVGTTSDPWWIPNASGTYFVIATGGDDCPRLSNTVEVQVSGLIGFEQNGLSVFPNPVSDRMTIRAEQPLQGTLVLLDVAGREISRKPLMLNAGDQVVWWLADVASGAYFLRWQSKDGISVAQGVLISRKNN